MALRGVGVCVAAESSRSTNHRGNPVAAAIAVQWLRNVRREMKMRLDIQAFNDKGGGVCKWRWFYFLCAAM